jgi:hypothetical protein
LSAFATAWVTGDAVDVDERDGARAADVVSAGALPNALLSDPALDRPAFDRLLVADVPTLVLELDELVVVGSSIEPIVD